MKTRARRHCCVWLCVGLFTARTLFSAQSPGSLDETFELPPGFEAQPYSSVFQLSGDLLLSPSYRIIRVRSDGTVVSEFPYRFEDGFGTVSFRELPDGKLLMFGPNLFDPRCWGMVRLDRNGALDPDFKSPFSEPARVYALTLRSNRLIVGGSYWTNASGWLARLRANGSIDSSFAAPSPNRAVTALAVVSNRIIVAGAFSELGEHSSPAIGALSDDGTFDSSLASPFDPLCEDCSVYSLNVRPSGELVLFGNLRLAGETEPRTLVRLKPDGAVDSIFSPVIPDGPIQRILVQPDGKIILVGSFDGIGDTNFSIAKRLNKDGSIDESFVSARFDAYDWAFEIQDALLQTDGRLVIVGWFAQEGHVPRRFVTRLNGDAPAGRSSLVAEPFVEVVEDRPNVSVHLFRSGALSGACSIGYFTHEQTARAGQNFIASTGRVRFAAGERGKSIDIPVLDNRLVDGARAFELRLSELSGADLVGPSNVIVQINDDEVENRVQFSAAGYPVKETQSHALVEVVRDVGSTGAVSVRYEIRSGTAWAGRDYVAVNGTLDFAEGQFTNWFLVPIINTPRADGNRSARLSLRDPGNGAVLGARSTATLAILDDESPAVITTLNESWVRAATRSDGEVRFDGNGIIAVSEPVEITSNVIVNGRRHEVVLSGQNLARLFNVATGGSLTLKNLTIANGFSTNAGAIWNDGTLTLINCTFSNNIARGADGVNGVEGPLNEGQTRDGTPGQDARGGAIVNNGTLLASNSLFIANASIGGKGGNGGAGGTTNYCCDNGGNGAPGGSASGGAIFSPGMATLHHSRFITNVTAAGSGGSGNVGGLTNFTATIFVQGNSGTSAPGGEASGGAITLLGSFSVSNCNFADNSASGGRGGDGATGRGSWRSGSSGMNGVTGGNAKGGAISAGQAGKIGNAVFLKNSARAGDGGNGGGGGMASTASRSGDGGIGSEGGNALGGAIHSDTGISVTTVTFDHNSVHGGNGGNGSDGRASPAQAGSGGNGGQGGRGGSARGGALVASGGSLSNSVFSVNQALAGDGGAGGGGGPACGCRFSGGGNGAPGGQGGISFGGAIYFTSGSADVSSSVYRENLSTSGSGGNGGTGPNGYVSHHITFGAYPGSGAGGGNSGAAHGGGIASSAELHLSECTFFSNRVETAAGGSGANGGAGNISAGHGGAAGSAGGAAGGSVWIDNSFVSTDCGFVGNAAVGGSGGHGGTGGHQRTSAFSFDLYGRGSAGGAGGWAIGGAFAFTSNIAEIVRARFEGNSVSGGSGGDSGANDMNIEAWFLRGGTGGEARGGSIDVSHGTLLLSESTIIGGRTLAGAAGASAPTEFRRSGGVPLATPGASGGAAMGGGLSITTGTVQITGCTLALNHAQGGLGGTGGARLRPNVGGGDGGYGGSGYGGALAQWGGVLAMTNNTFFSNIVSGGVGGTGGANNGGARGGGSSEGVGGAVSSMTATALIVNVSFARNSCIAGSGGRGGASGTNTFGPDGQAGIAYGGTVGNFYGQISVVNSLFKHHDDSSNAYGDFIDQGNNISSDASFAFTQSSSRNNVDPLVGPLVDNGGPTRTLALLSGSPAIDAGNNDAAPPTDQRGIVRPFGAHSDVGAFEADQPTFTISGRIEQRGGVPGVVLSAGVASTVADANGYYTIRNLFAGRYVIRPEFADARFIPASRNVRLGPDADGVNFTMRATRARLTCTIAGEDFSLCVDGVPNERYVLDTSTDFSSWTFVKRVRLDDDGWLDVKLPRQTNEVQRYFRVRRD